MPTLHPDSAPALHDDEPLDSDDQMAQAWGRARTQAERDAILYEGGVEQRRQIRSLTAAVERLTAIVGHSAEAAADFAAEHRGEHKIINANLTLLAEQARTNGQAIGQLAEGQGMIAAELAARARQESIHETEITAQRQALTATAAEVRAVRLKAAALKAGLGASAIAVWEAAKHLLPLLSP